MNHPKKEDLKYITKYDTLGQLMILKDICHKIYIARNITLNADTILEQMKSIDILFRNNENYN